MNYILYMHPKITTIYEMISQYEVIYNDFVSMWKAYYKLQLLALMLLHEIVNEVMLCYNISKV